MVRSTTDRSFPSRALPLVLAALAGMALAGCQQSGTHRSGQFGASHHGRAITVDGRLEEWPRNAASLADEHFLYFRVTVEDHGMPLQAAPETVSLWLDVDGRADTGARNTEVAEAGTLGVDLVVEFSPPSSNRPGELSRGVAVYAPTPDGEMIALSHAHIDLLSTPTYATGAYEIRIARHIDESAPQSLRAALTSRGQARSMFVVRNAAREILGWSDPETFNLPSAAGGPARVDVSLPAKPQGAIRIVSWNVLDNAPLSTPAPFARIISTLEPDIIVLQEMWDTDPATIIAWFTSVVTGDVLWQARTRPDGQGGVAIVSRYPLRALGSDALSLPASGNRPESPVRFIGAMIDTPQGEVAIGTVHLKCCGTAGSSEDQRRIDEARAINHDLSQALATSAAQIRVIAGDVNLVGSRTPLELLAAGLDADGMDLQPVTTLVHGDAAVYTWFDAQSSFSPGRLDWILAGESGARVVNAFVLDGRRLTDSALARMGLTRTDTAASDHLPVVVDIRPAR